MTTEARRALRSKNAVITGPDMITEVQAAFVDARRLDVHRIATGRPDLGLHLVQQAAHIRVFAEGVRGLLVDDLAD